MAYVRIAAPLPASYFDFDPNEYAFGDPSSVIPLSGAPAAHFRRTEITRGEYESEVDQILWSRGPAAASPFIELLDGFDGDADIELDGDESEDSEASQCVTLQGEILTGMEWAFEA